MRTNMNLTQIIIFAVLGLLEFAAEAAPTTSYYIYDEVGHIIGEYDADGNPIQEHIYLSDKPVAVVVNGAIDNVVIDQLDTPRKVVDGNKNVIWSFDSDPFGNGQPIGSLTYNLRFPGQYSDSETGHSYNYHRDYDPSVGRYIEGDPTGLEGGLNAYVYADDAPLDEIDVSGLCPAVLDTGFGEGVKFFNKDLPGHCTLNQLKSRFIGPLVSSSGSCTCGEKTMTCTYSLSLEEHQRSRSADCKQRVGTGNWSDYGDAMTGPPHLFTFTIDCKTNKAISVSNGSSSQSF